MEWGAKREPLALPLDTSYDSLNDGLPLKKMKVAQVDAARASSRSPAGPTATASGTAAAAAASVSPASPSQPMASTAPPAYPQRGQPAQTPQQTLPTIPEVHEEADYCPWPAAAAAHARLATGGQGQRAHGRPRGSSPPKQQQQQSKPEEQQEQQQQGSHQEPAPELELAAGDAEPPPPPPQQTGGRDGEATGDHGDFLEAARDGPRQRRRLGSTAGCCWVLPPQQLAPGGPAAALALGPELQLSLHAQYVHQPRPGFPGWAVVPYSPSPPLQQDPQQQQAMPGTAEQWQPPAHHAPQQVQVQALVHQLLQAQQQQQAAADGRQLPTPAECDTAMMPVADEHPACPHAEPLAHKLPGGLERSHVSLEHLAGAVLGAIERHGSGSRSGGSLEQRLSGGLEAALSPAAAPPTAPQQQGLPAAATGGLPPARFGAPAPPVAASYGSNGGGDSMED
ncbi:hypothetical protein CHLNCDRAFT_132999 [Chlorella variabilis]|uniref:Uncharacterized protein n=1 Tax=Chlorella variabilis TaxID=554065 RepID=E1Z245_CHLVA|nr:hypothetical protein CHLNCDRAFT_132999 [Chlorella variabilis]EFN59933.1 hypothetical protein CHLNCDRAFT_132999 [Chlorella variabilis]|eukprot:XP_005852035.1 hypothetical protein CHLNCDRAFT_132999 [Chlorella variabilis]